MEIEEFFAPRLHIVLGKGGVGKTTLCAALAVLASRHGRETVICETEGKSGLGACFGRGALDFKGEELAEGVWARTIWPDQALIEYLRDHSMTRLSSYLVKSNVVDIVATAIPGLKDVLVLGKIKQLVRRSREYERPYDTVIVDSPAAGHALTFLTSAAGIADAVRVGPVRDHALDVLELLHDHESTVVHIATLPEETPVNETVETAEVLTERVGCRLGVIFVNGCYPKVERIPSTGDLRAMSATTGLKISDELATSLVAASTFLEDRFVLQEEQRRRLAEMLPLPQVALPFQFTAEFGPDEVGELASAAEEELLKADSVKSL